MEPHSTTVDLVWEDLRVHARIALDNSEEGTVVTHLTALPADPETTPAVTPERLAKALAGPEVLRARARLVAALYGPPGRRTRYSDEDRETMARIIRDWTGRVSPRHVIAALYLLPSLNAADRLVTRVRETHPDLPAPERGPKAKR